MALRNRYILSCCSCIENLNVILSSPQIHVHMHYRPDLIHLSLQTYETLQKIHNKRFLVLISSMYFRYFVIISSWKRDEISMNVHYFVIISPWERAGPFIWTNLNPNVLCQVWLKLAQVSKKTKRHIIWFLPQGKTY